MLKIYALLIFCGLILSPLKSQTIFTSFQPDDKGIGIGYRTDKLYVSLSHGEYDLPIGYLEHGKLAFGGVYFPPNRGFTTSRQEKSSFVTIGVCLHSYNKQSPQEFKRIVTYPLSIELGCGAYLGAVSIAFRFDPAKNESSIDIGFKF
jgi:hypothetical protein